MAEDPTFLMPILFLGEEERFVKDAPEVAATQQVQARRMDFRPRVMPADAPDPAPKAEVQDEGPKDSSAIERASDSPDGSQTSQSDTPETPASVEKVPTPTPTPLHPPLDDELL